MPVLIDTNIAVYLTDAREEIVGQVATLEAPPVMSLITLAELEGGIHRDAEQALARRSRLDALLRWVAVLPFDRETVSIYGDIVASIGFSRQRVLDRLIAATALAADMTLITSNGSDFRDIPNLKLEVWPSPAQ